MVLLFYLSKGTLEPDRLSDFINETREAAAGSLNVDVNRMSVILREMGSEDCCDNVKSGLITLYAYVHAGYDNNAKRVFIERLNAVFDRLAGYRGLHRNTIIIKEHKTEQLGYDGLVSTVKQ